MDREEYMEYALALASRAAEEGEIPVGCVIADADGNIIGRGRNKREESHDATHHAEIEAIREACGSIGDWRLGGCTIYVTLEPCPMCAGACVMSRLKRVVYAVSDPKMGFLGGAMKFHDLPTLNHSLIVNSGVLEEDCARLLKTFFSLKRAISKSAKASSSQSGAE